MVNERRGKPRVTQGGRLRDWVRTLRGRFRPVALRRYAPAMVFRQPPAPGGAERVFERATVCFAPRLMLSVRTSITTAGSRARTFLLQPSDPPGAVPRPIVMTLTVPAVAAPMRTLRTVRYLPGAMAPATSPAPGELPSPSSAAPPRLAPPELVRRRLRHHVASEVVRRTRLRIQEQDDEQSLVRRTLRRVRRVEERTPAAPQRTLRQASRPQDAPSAAASAPNTFAGVPFRPSPHPPAAAYVQAPQVDVGALAEQVMRKIDYRLTAWRERTGRI